MAEWILFLMINVMLALPHSSCSATQAIICTEQTYAKACHSYTYVRGGWGSRRGNGQEAPDDALLSAMAHMLSRGGEGDPGPIASSM